MKDWCNIKASTEVYLNRQSMCRGAHIDMYDHNGELVGKESVYHNEIRNNDDAEFWKVFRCESTMVVKV